MHVVHDVDLGGAERRERRAVVEGEVERRAQRRVPEQREVGRVGGADQAHARVRRQLGQDRLRAGLAQGRRVHRVQDQRDVRGGVRRRGEERLEAVEHGGRAARPRKLVRAVHGARHGAEDLAERVRRPHIPVADHDLVPGVVLCRVAVDVLGEFAEERALRAVPVEADAEALRELECPLWKGFEVYRLEEFDVFRVWVLVVVQYREVFIVC